MVSGIIKAEVNVVDSNAAALVNQRIADSEVATDHEVVESVVVFT